MVQVSLLAPDRVVSDATVPVRLAAALLARSQASPRAGVKAVPLRQVELAEAIGATRSNVNRQLAKWLRQGIIAYSGGVLVVVGAAALQELTQSG